MNDAMGAVLNLLDKMPETEKLWDISKNLFKRVFRLKESIRKVFSSLMKRLRTKD